MTQKVLSKYCARNQCARGATIIIPGFLICTGTNIVILTPHYYKCYNLIEFSSTDKSDIISELQNYATMNALLVARTWTSILLQKYLREESRELSTHIDP